MNAFYLHVAIMLLGGVILSTAAEADERPNILYVVTDDQAPWAMGCAAGDRGHDSVPMPATPNMDRLAREGARFRNFLCATPVCSPARVALATGRYASEFGIKDFIPSPGHKLFDPDEQSSLDPEASVTFAELLHDAGYYTGLVGKWHLGDWTLPGQEKYHPTNQGYDYFMGLTSGGTSPSDPMLEKDGVEQERSGLTTDLLTDDALGFLQTAAAREEPFLLSFHTRAPHGKWLPVAPEDWQPYAEMDPAVPSYPGLNIAKVKKSMREYLASTSGVDRNLGRLLAELDRLDLSDNTVVIFTSDHGYNMGHNGIVHKGNGIWATNKRPPGEFHRGTRVISDKYRPNLYDLSLRVPAIVRWPGEIQSGQVIDETATHLDLFPTLLAMADVDAPVDLPLRGRSLMPLLQGEAADSWNEEYFGQYSMIHYAEATMRCLRTPEYKLIRDFQNDQRDEFYDLRNDPEENENLIETDDPVLRQVIEDMHQRMLIRMDEIGDRAMHAN
ncbi:sulfatase family protein [Allorhodopirellula solitaria]|uniref:Arylsulfatase n=1 Tax=Allorhodopirellula solitaria TaxID=2527987 RepID=A0A5C5YH66_9BACT|nr:sulfatase-like hydrolase/transferase [Allorhodopirellula solitaria]TWT73961.1 Arylsulfatase [Allorhodopirellula solitaria]